MCTDAEDVGEKQCGLFLASPGFHSPESEPGAANHH